MTRLLYLEDFDVLECTSTVTGIGDHENGRTIVNLDATCFYPKGGGQDWDTGIIKSATSEFRVEEVRLDEHGTVQHVGTFTDSSFLTGDHVQCAVDAERRAVNSRLHSAGHVIDLAVDELGLPWVPGKGAHFPHMSFVEYEGELDREQAPALREQIERRCNEVVTQGGTNEIAFMPREQMSTVCRHVPEYIPTNKPSRVVIYRSTFGVPCGGTHVRELESIGGIGITKIKIKNGTIRVSYALK